LSRCSADSQESKTAKKGKGPRRAQKGGSQNCTLLIFLDLGSLAYAPKMLGAKSTHPPCGPLRCQLPIVWFWAPEGEWGCGIGKGGCTAVCISGGCCKGPPYVFLEGPLPKEEGRNACAPSLAAARLAWMLLCCLFI